MIILVGDKTRNNSFEDTAVDVLASGIVGVNDRVGLLAKML
jgi:hypothetical protein